MFLIMFYAFSTAKRFLMEMFNFIMMENFAALEAFFQLTYTFHINYLML